MFAISAIPGNNQATLVPPPAMRALMPGEIVCQTLELGVCGTDREILLSETPAVPPGEKHLVLGHECLARVVELGPDAGKGLSVGDLVVPVVRRPVPGATRRVDMLDFTQCTERGIYLEHGFGSPRFIDRAEYVYKVPSSIANIAIFAEPLAVSEKGVNEAFILQQARLGSHEWTGSNLPRVLVTGLGPIGFASVLAVRARGWDATIAGRDDASSFRAQLAQSFGAHYLKMTPEYWETVDPTKHGFDLCLECTGSEDVMADAARALAPCGIMVWLGCSRVPKAGHHNMARMMRDGLIRNHLHVGSVNSAPRDFVDALAHLEILQKSHSAELQRMITARVKPEDSLPQYVGRQSQGIKTVIQFAE